MGSLESVPPPLLALLEAAKDKRGLILVLSGAGISAESGIPTFRGPEGYWKVGSRNYFPEELATRAAFSNMPDEIWAWYLWRRGICLAAEPNVAHRALVELEAQLGDRFLLVTQNVDGLHRRAGSSRERTYEIHGRIDEMRCYLECSPELLPIPAAIPTAWPKDRRIGEEERALLRCPRCGSRTRPHVLWFDESYDEHHFRYESSLAAVERTDLLLVIGTSGATSLPHRLVVSCLRLGTSVVVLNLDESPFSALAAREENGYFWKATAKEAVPAITGVLIRGPHP